MARLVVPVLADLCAIDIIEANLTTFREPIVAASDPEREALVLELRRLYPPRANANFGAAKVLRTGEPELVTEIPESLLRSIAQDAKHIRLIQQLGAKSYMVVPLIARERKLGAIAFVSAQPERRYGQADLAIAEELARRVAVAIDNARLYQEALEANRMKDEFLAIVSHELRTPLNTMLGWSQILRTRNLDEARTAKAIEIIERNAKLQGKLIEDLLDVSRIVQGKLQLNMHPVHLVPVINAAVEDVRPRAQSKAIQINLMLDPSVAQVMGDSARLQQIVWNLLTNAVKFTPHAGKISIRLEQVNAYAQIEISDTGEGISADFLPYVFERFRQANNSKTRAQGGLGLGLAIVRSLVEMHNGTVYAVSEGEGKGATFTVQLPAQDFQQPPPTNEALTSDFPNLNGLQVLVVDDDADTRELITFILEQCEAQVTAAASPGEALAAIAQFQPDILISDISMPDEDGYSLIRRVRTLAADQGKQIPAIALTALAKEDDQQEALSAGFQRYLAKPVNPSELVALVASIAQPY